MSETQSVRELAKAREPRKSAVNAAANISKSSVLNRKRNSEDPQPGPSSKSNKRANGNSAKNGRMNRQCNNESDHTSVHSSSVDSSSDGRILKLYF